MKKDKTKSAATPANIAPPLQTILTPSKEPQRPLIIPRNTAIDDLSTISTYRRNEEEYEIIKPDPYKDEKPYVIVQRPNTIISLEQVENELLGMRPNAHRLFMFLLSLFLSNSRQMPLDHSMGLKIIFKKSNYYILCGGKGKMPTHFSKEVDNALTQLTRIKISWNNARTSGFIPLSGGWIQTKRRGEIDFRFGSLFAEMIWNYGRPLLSEAPIQFFLIDARNPVALTIATKMISHDSIKANRDAGTADILSISTLHVVCGDLLPSIDEVAKNDRNYLRRIINPISSAIKHLIDIGFLKNASYCDAKRAKPKPAKSWKDDYDRYVIFELNRLKENITPADLLS